MDSEPNFQDERQNLAQQLESELKSGSGPAMARFALSCLSAIPVVGGAIGGVGAAWSEKEQERINHILRSWLQLQEDEIREIGVTMMEIMSRLDLTDDKIKERMESPEYLKIVKKCFRDWSAAESEEKRVLIRQLLIASASTSIASDDRIRLFVTWIDRYSEGHFAILREVYNNSGITRAEIWRRIHGEQVPDNSSDADLFKLLIDDLSTGHLIRQHREVDVAGRFRRSQSTRRMGSSPSPYLASVFDDVKPYELTSMGEQFVHYTMRDEMVTKIEASSTFAEEK